MTFATINQEPKVEETTQFSLKVLCLSIIILFALSANYFVFCNHTNTSAKENTEQHYELSPVNSGSIIAHMPEKTK